MTDFLRGGTECPPPPKAHCATTKIEISQLFGLIETWDFRKDLPPQKAHCATTKIQISQLLEFIETRDFFEDDLEKSDWKWALKKYFMDRSRIMNHTFLFIIYSCDYRDKTCKCIVWSLDSKMIKG